MFIRILPLLIAIATPALAQNRAIFGPPKAKVVRTPPPAPEPAPTPAPKKRKPSSPKPAAPKAPAAALTDYMPTVKAAFAARWAEVATPRLAEFTPGNCSVLFKLDAEGKVTAVAIPANSSNEAFAKFCEQFVRDTAFEKPPEKALIDGQAEIPFTFTVL